MAAATAQNDSTDAVSLTSGPSVQSIVAKLTQATADELKGATEGTGSLKPDTPVASASGADGGSQAVSAFQAHMSVSSHLQPTVGATGGKMSAPVGTPAFNDELGGTITWMAHQGVQSASLQLTPEHLGPVDVRIAVQDGSATVSFNASHADTRAALEQALPRLRDMFATQGLTLSDASVSQQSPRGQPQKQHIAAIGPVGSVGDEPTSSLASVAGTRLGLVDTYA
jgi:flagellar hook-length control protein FliK